MTSSSPTSTNSSLSSSKRFGLDEHDTKKILVYNHPHGLITSSQQELCKTLDNDRNLRVSRVRIPWGNSHIDIRHRDLVPEDVRKKMEDKPTMNLSLASINLGRIGHIKRLFGFQKDLYVVSPESSPNTSPEQSQNISPNSTFSPEGRRREPDIVGGRADRTGRE